MIGWIMLAIPLVAFFVHVAKVDGIKDALKLYLGTAAFVSWIVVATHLIKG